MHPIRDVPDRNRFHGRLGQKSRHRWRESCPCWRETALTRDEHRIAVAVM